MVVFDKNYYHDKKNPDELKIKVESILTSLSLTPDHDVCDILSDKTRITYTDTVISADNKKLFIKIKLFSDEWNNNNFNKNIALYTLLNDKKYSLLEHTPALVNHADDFLLFEYIEAPINLGSRHEYDVSEITLSDLSQIVTILNSIKEVDARLLAPNFEKRAWNYYEWVMFEESGYDIQDLQTYYTKEELACVESLKTSLYFHTLVSSHAGELSHGDFQSPNFVKSHENIYVLDWDLASITIPFFDSAKFYNHMYRKPDVQKTFLDTIKKSIVSDEERILQTFSFFIMTFLWVKVMRKDYIQNKISQSDPAISEIFEKRLHDSRAFIRDLTPHI